MTHIVRLNIGKKSSKFFADLDSMGNWRLGELREGDLGNSLVCYKKQKLQSSCGESIDRFFGSDYAVVERIRQVGLGIQ